MSSKFIDIHPHIITEDVASYPRSPLFGKQSDWSKERPVAVDDLLAAMDEAGVDKAAVVQSSTCYGFDNAYVADSCAKHSDRLAAVGSVDLTAPDVVETMKAWTDRGVAGFRLFTGGSTQAFDSSGIDDPRVFKAWEYLSDAGISMCMQTDPGGLAQVAGMAKRFPKVKILLDHCARPDLTDGPPYRKAASLFGLAPFENVYLKLTPRTFNDSRRGEATSESFFARLVEAFGAQRLAWGSNYPTSEGPLGENLQRAQGCLSSLSEGDRAWIFAGTAQSLYPTLAD